MWFWPLEAENGTVGSADAEDMVVLSLRSDERGELMSAEARCYRVYIIEVMPKWYEFVAPGVAPGKKCFYVGQTGKDVSERYREHRAGVRHGRRAKRPVEVFRKIRAAKDGVDLTNKVDVKLRRTMFEGYPEMPSVEEAEALEESVVDELRAAGHVVYPRGLGEIQFKA